MRMKMKTLPSHLIPYKKTNIFNQETIPAALLNDHSTKSGVWGKICLLEGELLYTITQTNEEYRLNEEIYGVVEPEVKHKVTPLGNVRFYVEFYK